MNQQAPAVRPASREDVAAIIDVFRASVRQIASRDYTPAQVLAWAPDEIDPAAWAHRSATRYAWVAEIDLVIAGFSELEVDGHLDMMYVHPAFQRRGVASALFEPGGVSGARARSAAGSH